MKKILITLLSILTLSSAIFAMENIATTYQTNLKPQDMVEIFMEELNRPLYIHTIADYKVYTQPDKQSCVWSVEIDYEGYYNDDLEYVPEKSIYLFMTNGYVCLKSFGKPTIANLKESININEDEAAAVGSLYDSAYYFIKESEKWIKRYNKNYLEDELKALEMLHDLTLQLAR